MNAEFKLQAYLDGELSDSEAKEVAALLEKDSHLGALCAELSQTRLMLNGNEPEHHLPESREFYWSKIEREISRLETDTARPALPWWLTFLRRHLASISGVGVAALLAITAALQMQWVSPDLLEEIENPLEGTGSFSFRSESQKMTVVWISNPWVPTVEEEIDPFEDLQ